MESANVTVPAKDAAKKATEKEKRGSKTDESLAVPKSKLGGIFGKSPGESKLQNAFKKVSEQATPKLSLKERMMANLAKMDKENKENAT